MMKSNCKLYHVYSLSKTVLEEMEVNGKITKGRGRRWGLPFFWKFSKVGHARKSEVLLNAGGRALCRAFMTMAVP